MNIVAKFVDIVRQTIVGKRFLKMKFVHCSRDLLHRRTNHVLCNITRDIVEKFKVLPGIEPR